MEDPATEIGKTYLVRKSGEPLVKKGGELAAVTAWDSGAEVLTDFAYPWADAVAPRTEFRALWDGEWLAFRYEIEDADVVLGEGVDAKERVIGSDRAELFFSTGPELMPYYCLEIDPRGNVLDYEARFHRQMNWDWRCAGLVVEAGLGEKGYWVHAALPLSLLRELGCLQQDEGGSGKGEGSGLYLIAGLYRAEFRHGAEGEVLQDWISWIHPGTPRPDFHVPGSFGRLRLLE